MAGFLTALAGGALEGFGQGALEGIKATREEKLRKLELDRAEILQNSRQTFEAGQNDANRGIQREQIAATRDAAAATLALNEKLGVRGLDIEERRITSAENIARDQMANAKDIAEFQAGAQMKLNSRLQEVIKDGKRTTVLMTPEGTEIPKLKGADGKEYEWVGADASTDAAKNYNFMIANDFDPKQAAKWAFGAKSGDIADIEKGLLNSMIQGTFGTVTPDKMEAYRRMAHEGAVGIVGVEDAAVPAVPSSAAETTPDILPIPDGETPESMVAAAKEAVAAGEWGRTAALRELAKYGITAAEAGL